MTGIFIHSDAKWHIYFERWFDFFFFLHRTNPVNSNLGIYSIELKTQSTQKSPNPV